MICSDVDSRVVTDSERSSSYVGFFSVSEETEDMNVELEPSFDEQKHTSQVNHRLLFGIPKPAAATLNPDVLAFHPIAPNFSIGQFVYTNEQRLLNQPNCLPVLIPPPAPEPPAGRSYPLAPPDGYKLRKDNRYTRGFVYASPYDLSKANIHRSRMIAIATPPNIRASKVDGHYLAEPIVGMVQLEPGIPFVVHLNGDPNRTHTIACLQTLDSLAEYPDFIEIQAQSVQLAKLAWGCPKGKSSPEIPPIYSHFLKRNDRSAARDSLHHDDFDGSFNLGNTILKGKGQGTILPAVQTNLSHASAHMKSLLKTLHKLYRYILPKCISRFEYEVSDFQSIYSNIFGFGGLDPNGTGMQMNVSSLSKTLADAIGNIQGFFHADQEDDFTRFTFFILLLRMGPTADPGAFCLARGGLYSRVLNAWIVFLVFKGTDLHSGFEPVEDREDHEKWVNGALDSAWHLAGPQNRLGFVNYPSRLAADRTGSLNATPATGFGNYGSSGQHKAVQQDFATHGGATLGSVDEYANRMAREAVFNFYNTLSLCNLDLNTDLNDLMASISIRDPQSGDKINMRPLPFNPQTDDKVIRDKISFYLWHREECRLFYRRVTKQDLARYREQLAALENETAVTTTNIDNQDVLELPSGDGPLNIEAVVKVKRINSMRVFFVRLEGIQGIFRVDESSSRIRHNNVILQSLAIHAPPTLSKKYAVPGNMLQTLQRQPASAHPETGATSLPSPTGTVGHVHTSQSLSMAEVQNCGSMSSSLNDNPQPTDSAFISDRVAPSSPKPSAQPMATRSKGKSSTKRKYADEDPADDDSSPPISYEVREILAHRENEETGELEFLLDWKGYPSSEQSWSSSNDIDGCVELLAEYASKHNLPTVTGKSASGTVLMAENFQKLSDILSDRKLADELAGLKNDYSARLLDPKSWSMSGCKDWANDLSNHQSEIGFLSGFLPIIADNDIAADLVRFDILHRTALKLPTFGETEWRVGILHRSALHAACTAWITIFDWYTSTEPRLCNFLVQTRLNRGRDQMLKRFPTVAGLVNHLVELLLLKVGFQLRQDWKVQRAARVPNLVKAIERCSELLGRPVLDENEEATPADTLDIPIDMYGLLPQNGPRTGAFTQPRKFILKLKPFQWKKTLLDDFLYTAGASSLAEIWSTCLILPHLRCIDKFNTTKRGKKTDDQAIYDRAITRGAILSCIQDVCGGPAIFSSLQIGTFLQSPTMLFNSSITKDARFSAAVRSNPTKVLQPFINSLTALVEERPGITATAERIAGIVQQGISGLAGNPLEALEEEEITEDRPHTDGLSEGTQPAPKRKCNKSLRLLQLDSKTLLMNFRDRRPHLTATAIVLREALNKARGLPPAEERLSRIHDGRHPSMSSASPPQNLDQTNPCRHSSRYAALVREYLPPHLLTCKTGLSSLLSFMGTGQGSRTTSFLDRLNSRPERFVFRDISQLVDKFNDALASNANLFGAQRDSSWIICSDMMIWGTATQLMSLDPTPTGTKKGAGSHSLSRHEQSSAEKLMDRFKPYWSDNVQKTWLLLLGDMVDQNPLSWSHSRPSWSATYTAIQGLDIPLFKSGLTVFQTVNNLAFSEICQTATKEEMSYWVSQNRGLGAYGGLTHLGFSMDPRSIGQIQAAFHCVYTHMDTFLSVSDRKILNFNAIFVEHVLCKVKRYVSRLDTSGSGTGEFRKCEKKAEAETKSWVVDANLTDSKAFPFPLFMESEEVDKVVERLSNVWLNPTTDAKLR
ncbi:hypothetical protein CPB83DRAFT_894357 [Crepidotus variabilis]|uniref:Chromo domain-containing protein n=1 Tax=Crepidotus variabilis TaxID=179855 RepID=A0A9P6JPJ1_9AGAR|nr:hypothetical protein CPB83DRAFT_894357 [Crepidotus variabilis]